MEDESNRFFFSFFPSLLLPFFFVFPSLAGTWSKGTRKPGGKRCFFFSFFPPLPSFSSGGTLYPGGPLSCTFNKGKESVVMHLSFLPFFFFPLLFSSFCVRRRHRQKRERVEWAIFFFSSLPPFFSFPLHGLFGAPGPYTVKGTTFPPSFFFIVSCRAARGWEAVPGSEKIQIFSPFFPPFPSFLFFTPPSVLPACYDG